MRLQGFGQWSVDNRYFEMAAYLLIRNLQSYPNVKWKDGTYFTWVGRLSILFLVPWKGSQ